MIQTALTNSYRLDQLDGKHQPGHVYKLALYSAQATLGRTTTAYTAENEASGYGYTAGGIVLAGRTAQLYSGIACLDWGALIDRALEEKEKPKKVAKKKAGEKVVPHPPSPKAASRQKAAPAQPVVSEKASPLVFGIRSKPRLGTVDPYTETYVPVTGTESAASIGSIQVITIQNPTDEETLAWLLAA